MTVKAGAYLRLSRDDERDGESMSIENQRYYLTSYIHEHGWELVDTYIDDGYTGLNFNRPDFQRMISDVKSGRINLVVVKDDCVNIELKSEGLENAGFCDGSSVF